ncbi:hypothetical protein [Xanthomonas medicagonis]|uniref:hypothetical protein n=1 Tax=Xanthomonas medicagonis TaxID=3160841 RepID=UPI003514AA78
MIRIAPEVVDFQINTTGVEIGYSELDGLTIRLTVVKEDKVTAATICFPVVAEFECVGMNFYERHFGEMEIVNSSTEMVDSGFYKNLDRISYAEKVKTYDPKQRFDLEEYYIPGNDSYLRVMASKYHVRIDEA